MKFCVSERIGGFVRSFSLKRRTYDCQEPWIGIFSVGANGDVICCPCYAKVRVGSVDDSSIQEVWNSEPLLRMRAAFRKGRLPRECRGQLCPVVVGHGMTQSNGEPSASEVQEQGHA
jgi:radical SAM protein with 4Fe4S-binding SPASM domain